MNQKIIDMIYNAVAPMESTQPINKLSGKPDIFNADKYMEEASAFLKPMDEMEKDSFWFFLTGIICDSVENGFTAGMNCAALLIGELTGKGKEI